MKIILFCNYPYAFSILRSIADECLKRNWTILWYFPAQYAEVFPYKNEAHTTSIAELDKFLSDVIFVPGNIVPWYLRGLKVQVFHGLAGEKKGHFRIREYFDLYLTQGPYFTRKFEELARQHKNFSVVETGWSKLDKLFKVPDELLNAKRDLLLKHKAKHLLLYAPTFSPLLTSANLLFEPIQQLLGNPELIILLKFHDKMDARIKDRYAELKHPNLLISSDKDITTSLQISDLMLSDTSSVVYEFSLLDKPLVTLSSKSKNINWLNLQNATDIPPAVEEILGGRDSFKNARKHTINQYHPYADGNSAIRMLDAVVDYLRTNNVPEKRKVSLYRKYKIYRKYGLRK
jgi:CDP-ribitol ribitolphosphotransferase / teichoic acid ribitol-phosphate polymerase